MESVSTIVKEDAQRILGEGYQIFSCGAFYTQSYHQV